MTALEFTPLRISTLVTTGHLGTTIKLNNLFDNIHPVLIPIGYPGEGILKMEHENRYIGVSARNVLTKRRVSDKTFFNQSTLVIRKLRDATEFKEVNLKLFANGGFQMTGVTTEEFSREVLDWVIKELAVIPNLSEKPLTVAKFAIQLLNSDYKVNAPIKRAELHRLLCEQYNLSSTLETTIYQGVNTKYYYNEANTGVRGICMCPRFCNGQGDGSAIGACKRITVAVFQTGSIIITGARTKKQLDEAYEYINNVMRCHASLVTKS
jgi:TATA-box binding protein (TBP) (component of TFIID and TFIIIB)